MEETAGPRHVSVTINRYPKYVRYNAAGRTSFKRFAGLLDLMAADIDQFEDDRVMIDLRDVEGRLTTSEQRLLGEVVAARLPLIKREHCPGCWKARSGSEEWCRRGGPLERSALCRVLAGVLRATINAHAKKAGTLKVW